MIVSPKIQSPQLHTVPSQRMNVSQKTVGMVQSVVKIKGLILLLSLAAIPAGEMAVMESRLLNRDAG